MNTLKTAFRSFLIASVAMALIVMVPLSYAPSAHAQDAYGVSLNRALKGNPVLRGVGSDDSDVALLIKYVGTSASGKVAVSAAGDLTFTAGASGSETADTTFECPVSGGLGGVIDVSDSACNTLGEVVDIINTSTSDFRAVIVDGLRSDSSDDALVTISATAANSPDGLALKWDTDVALKSSQLVAPQEARSMKFYLTGRSTLIPNPWTAFRTVLFNTKLVSTYGSGTSVWTINCADTQQKLGAGTETVNSYSAASAATTVEKVFDFSPYGIGCPVGQRMVSRLTNSAAMASTQHYVAGLQY